MLSLSTPQTLAEATAQRDAIAGAAYDLLSALGCLPSNNQCTDADLTAALRETLDAYTGRDTLNLRDHAEDVPDFLQPLLSAVNKRLAASHYVDRAIMHPNVLPGRANTFGIITSDTSILACWSANNVFTLIKEKDGSWRELNEYYNIDESEIVPEGMILDFLNHIIPF